MQMNIREALCSGHYSWLWVVHCETSTGVLNDLCSFKKLCSQYGITLAVDCVSAIGTTAVDLTGCCLLNGCSGKGLLSYTGLSFVFHNEEIAANETCRAILT